MPDVFLGFLQDAGVEVTRTGLDPRQAGGHPAADERLGERVEQGNPPALALANVPQAIPRLQGVEHAVLGGDLDGFRRPFLDLHAERVELQGRIDTPARRQFPLLDLAGDPEHAAQRLLDGHGGYQGFQLPLGGHHEVAGDRPHFKEEKLEILKPQRRVQVVAVICR